MDDVKTLIGEKISVLTLFMKRQQAVMSDDIAVTDATRGQGRIIAMLKISPVMKTKELSAFLGIRQQSLNELLGKLERNGYVERKPSKEDGRVMLVCLTEKGRTVEQNAPVLQGLLDCLTEEELNSFYGCLSKMVTACSVENSPIREETGEHMDEEAFIRLKQMHDRAFKDNDPDEVLVMYGNRSDYGSDGEFSEDDV